MNKSKSSKSDKLGKNDYYDQLAPLQLEFNDLARWLQHTGKRLVVLIEGRDTAGKGGVITAMSETLNPRQCRTVALAKPSEREQTPSCAPAACSPRCSRPGGVRAPNAKGVDYVS